MYKREQTRLTSLDAADTGAFVEKKIMQQIQRSHGKLIGVLPATDMQSNYLRDNPHAPRRPWFYSYINFDRILDEPHLIIQSCNDLVKHCDIYRTAFAQSSGSFFQAMFDSWESVIDIIADVDSIESAFNMLVQE
jgi:hypothetical protein